MHSLTVGEQAGRIGRRVEHDRADRRRSGIPARTAVAVDDDLVELLASSGRLVAEQRGVLRHGTRIAAQLSQYATTLPAARRICSASVDGIVRWHAWHVVPTSRAAPAPRFCARRRS